MGYNSTTQFKVQCLTVTQFEFFCVSVEVGFEIRDWQAVGMFVVYTQASAYIDMFHMYAVTLQFILQLIHAIAESLEVAHIEYL